MLIVPKRTIAKCQYSISMTKTTAEEHECSNEAVSLLQAYCLWD
jgi:hypothetical protein